jgi:hypothetical protein
VIGRNAAMGKPDGHIELTGHLHHDEPPRSVQNCRCPAQHDVVTDEQPVPTVLDRLFAAGLLEERIGQHLTAGGWAGGKHEAPT